MVDSAAELYVARGRAVLHFDLFAARPSDEELLAMMLGKSGKLRAPTLRVATTLIVGFNHDLLQSVLL